MITLNVARSLVGKNVVFTYRKNDNSTSTRWVRVEEVKECKNGVKMVLGLDIDDNETYKSFNIDRIVELHGEQQPNEPENVRLNSFDKANIRHEQMMSRV